MKIFLLGPNCVGKSTLSKLLSRKLGGTRVIHGISDEVVGQFYTRNKKRVTQAEIFFLKYFKKVYSASRKGLTIYDRHPVEQLIYNFDRFYTSDAYDSLTNYLIENTLPLKPSVVIILTADPKILVKRIKLYKSKSYRMFLDEERLRNLNKLYLLLYGLLRGMCLPRVYHFDACEPLPTLLKKIVLVVNGVRKE